ncbi:hypothetical protein BDF22DRAFT_171490 [Syncephalis plumigaleata]|nr:hypothetical protein BDF22DRAFT_171490 [Syncephalis plumigaleata]
MVPLRYDDFIGEVLDMNDVVRVINIYEDDAIGATPKSSPTPSTISGTETNGASPGSVNSRSKSEFNASPTSLYSYKVESTNENFTMRGCRPQAGGLEDRFRQCIYNEFSLAAFQAHCAREFTLESLLFFLEVEVFRDLAGGDPGRLPQGMRIEQYARYIYEIYIDNDAPLQVNLSEEIREEVANAERCSACLFDGAQDMVHATLKRHSFVRFEASDAHMLLARLRQQDPTRYYNANMVRSLAQLFPPNNKLLSYILSDAQRPRASSSSFQRQRFDASDDVVVDMCRAREETLARVLSRFHPGPDVTNAIDGYFTDDSGRLTPAQKQRCIRKERKLTHFFGHHPDPSQVQKQAESSEVSTIICSTQRPRLRSSASAASLDSIMSKTSVTTINSTNLHNSDSDTAANTGFQHRRRRLRKLEGFFGDRLPGDIVPTTSSGTHPISLSHSTQTYPGGMRDLNNSNSNSNMTTMTHGTTTSTAVTTSSQGQKIRRPNKIIKKNPSNRPQAVRVSDELDQELMVNQAREATTPQPLPRPILWIRITSWIPTCDVS